MTNPLPYVPGVIRTRFVWSDGMGHFGSRLFLEGAGEPYTQLDLAALASAISGYWSTAMKNNIANEYSLTEVDCLDIGSSTGATGTWQGSITGSNGVNQMPSSTCVNIRMLIADHYRGGHPVLHHPGGSQVVVQDARHWMGSYATNVTTAWQSMMNSIQAFTHGSVTNCVPCALLHYRPGNTTAQVKVSVAQGFYVPTRFGSMRRRLVTET